MVKVYQTLYRRNVHEMIFIFFSADFYKGRLTDKELADLENPPTTPKTIKEKGKVASKRRPSRPPKRVVVEEEDEEVE